MIGFEDLNTAGTSDDDPVCHAKKKTVLHDWRDELNYLRELDDERRKKEHDQQTTDYFSDATKKQWTDRCVEVRQYLNTLYSQFRQLRRQSLVHATK